MGCLSCKWKPNRVVDILSPYLPNRSRGRPFLKWDAKLASFSMAIFRCEWYDVPSNNDWLRQEHTYLRWCGVIVPLRPVINVVANVRRPIRSVASVPFIHQVFNDNWW